VSSTTYIIDLVERLTQRYKTRDPYELCDALGVRIRYKDLGQDIKAYYFYHSRIRNIVLNNRISKTVQRILVAHELGHDRLHKEIAMMQGFQEFELFDMARPAEYEANIFAAEMLIDDDELLELLNDEYSSFFGVARQLYVPADLLDFKFRVLKTKGYRIEPFYMSHGDFLKNDIEGQFDPDDF
jgi:Zn-dependent peptidase ImmA (M78 family)